MSRGRLFWALAVLGSLATPQGVSAQAGARIEGHVRSEVTQRPLSGVLVRIPAYQLEARTDSLGAFVFGDLPSRRVKVTAEAPGYWFSEIVARVPRTGVLTIDIELSVHVQSLAAVRVVADSQRTAEEDHAREFFARDVIPAATTISRREIRALPSLGDPDVMRALQALPSVVAANDFDSQLHVRGGAPDQNLVLLDGAPVYGMYHLFGLGSAFNPDAVRDVEFLRGTRPARFGGAMSSVVDIRQRDAGDVSAGESATDAGIGMLGWHLSRRGASSDDRLRWMASARHNHTAWNVFIDLPYSFYDAQTRVSWRPASGHEFTFSGMVNADKFAVLSDLSSRWHSAMATLGWALPRWHGWSTTTTAFASSFDATEHTGREAAPATSANDLLHLGLRTESSRDFDHGSLRLGVELEHLATTVDGTAAGGGFFAGRSSDAYLRPLTFAELDERLGDFRLNAGVRALAAGADGRALLEPRVAARWQPTDRAALTLGWSREHQALSALQDERTTMPGPPFYYVHPAGSPESRSDALNAEFTWWGRDWNASAGAYDRRDAGIPHWMPVQARDMSALSWDDGRVRGIELSARRFGARASGWIWYSLTDARYTNASASSSLYSASGSHYVPAATHRHAASALWMTRLWPSTTFSAQATYGSGQYLWPPTGNFIAPRFGFGPGPVITQAIEVAPWGTEQVLAPPTYRLDLGLRKTVAFQHWSMEPYVSVRNIGARRNLLTYDRIGSGYNGIFSLEPLDSFVKVLPTIGLDVRF